MNYLKIKYKTEMIIMSLYNTLFGINEDMPFLLGMLGTNTEYFSRFRDVELINDGTIIRVFTRTGGGNRKYYQDNWNKIRENPLYLKDYDDDFDNTYAYIEFDIPKKYKSTAKKMFKGEPIPFEQKFNKELEEMNKPETEAYKKANNIANKILGAIDNGNNIIEI